MTLPFAFLAGLLVAFAHRELQPALPGSASWLALLPGLLLALPTMLALWSLRAARRMLLTGLPVAVPPRALLRLSALATPLAVHLLFDGGAYGDCIDRWAWDSHLGRLLLTVLPVFVAELPRLYASTVAQLYTEIVAELGPGRALHPDDLPQPAELAPIVRLRYGWPLLTMLPLVLLGVLLDLLQLQRELYVFALATSPGVVAGSLVILLLAVLLLPWWFRCAFAVETRLPEPAGMRLRATAAALGFPPHRVLLLPTGGRALNAMLVGPLPFGRCLCFTDGLLRALDIESLRGVLAHEIGHARRGHPVLLLSLAVLVPLAALAPLRFVDLEALDPLLRAAIVVAGFALLWLLVRGLAHRFEREADAASVQALGAGPCSQALQVVSRLAVPVHPGRLARLLSLHPEEATRWQAMRRYELDPGYRAAFERRGRQLRMAIAGVLTLAAGVAVWGWAADWPYERVVWRLHSGDVVGATALAAQFETVPARWESPWRRLQQDLVVANELAPTATEWAAARLAYAGAFARAVEILLGEGPAAARAWFGLAIDALEQPSDLQRAVHAYCQAAADSDPERMETLKRLVQRLGVPRELAPVFAQ